jgi:glutaconate CoA-transferase subunit A
MPGARPGMTEEICILVSRTRRCHLLGWADPVQNPLAGHNDNGLVDTTMRSKLTSIKDAIRDIVRDGDSVVLGAALETDIPFAAAHEMIRQGKRDLTVIAPISDAGTDLLIGAGCVGGIKGAWVGNMMGGVGYNYRRACENGTPRAITVRDYTNLSLGLALFAGASGVPYMPVRSLLGSDIATTNPEFQRADNPFSRTREPVVLVPALTPDVTIVSVQRADESGTCHHWGSRGVAQEAALAAKRVIVLADEIVPGTTIASDPSRVLVPGHVVTAVCHAPAGQHPAPMTGRWQRDNAFFADYLARSKTRDGYLAWLEEWVLDVPNHTAYRDKLGTRLDELRIKGEALAAPVNYAAE